MATETYKQHLLREMQENPTKQWTAYAIIAHLTMTGGVDDYQANIWREQLALQNYIRLNASGNYSLTQQGIAWANNGRV